MIFLKAKIFIFLLIGGLFLNGLVNMLSVTDYETNLEKCSDTAQSFGVGYKDSDVVCTSLGADDSISSSEYNSKTKHLEVDKNILAIFEQHGFTYNNEVYPDNVNVHIFKKQYDTTTELLISFDNNSSFRSVEMYNGIIEPKKVDDVKMYLTYIPSNSEPYSCEEFTAVESELGVIEYDYLDYNSYKYVDCKTLEKSIPDFVVNEITDIKNKLDAL